MNDMTDTTERSEVGRDGCDSPLRASPQHQAGRPVPLFEGGNDDRIKSFNEAMALSIYCV